MKGRYTMSKLIYAIRDKKMELYNSPVLFDNDAVAIRAFGDLVTRDADSMIHAHPSDFSLVRLGSINLETGVIEQDVNSFVVVADGESFASKE